jgi:protein ImuB
MRRCEFWEVLAVTGRRQLCIHIPRLSIERAQRERVDAAAPAGRPLVLTRCAGGSDVVVSADSQAERLGVRPGMTSAQAAALAPQVLLVPDDPVGDRRALEQLADWATRFGPQVEAVEPDVLLVDVTGCDRLFRGEENLARQAVVGLARQGLGARAAIADTVGAAWALTHAGDEDVTIVPARQTRRWLAPLPPTALRLDTAAAARLSALGIRTVGGLLELPRAGLARRGGRPVVRRLQQALGEVFEGVGTRIPEEVVQARCEFEQPVQARAVVEAAAKRLLEEVFARLQASGRALWRLECVLYCEQAPPLTLAIRLTRPTRAPEHVAGLLSARLEGVDMSVGVCGVVVVARQTARWRPGQGWLFEQAAAEPTEEFSQLVDRLVGRLGGAAVLRARATDDYQPERAFRYASVEELSEVRNAPADVAVSGPARPVRLFSRPAPLCVIARVPDGPPTWLACRGREYVVAAARGPERLETGWWRGPDVRRDYFRVSVETGEQFWVFHDFGERRWYLHGVFA